METWEGDQVDGQFSQIGVQLTGEPQTAGDPTHDSGDKVVQIPESWGGELQGSEADIVQSLVIEDHTLVGVLDQLVDGKGGIIWLDDGIGHLGCKKAIHFYCIVINLFMVY